MSRFANYTPASYERNAVLADVKITLDQTGPSATVNSDLGKIVKSVTWSGADLHWTIEFNDKWRAIHPEITLGIDPAGGAAVTTVPRVVSVNPSVSSLVIAQYDYATTAQVAETAVVYLSLRLNA